MRSQEKPFLRATHSDRVAVALSAYPAAFMVTMSGTTCLVALPRIGQALSIAPADLTWVLNCYTIVVGGFTLLAGRACNLFEKRQVFLTGLGLFIGGSALCGCATAPIMLLSGRAIQGLGAALLAPAALASVNQVFTGAEGNRRALGIWGAITASAASAGLLLGGAVVDTVSWRFVFLVNVVACVPLVPVVLCRFPRTRFPRTKKFDLGGAALITAGLAVLVYAATSLRDAGWHDPRTVSAGIASLVLITAFLAVERNHHAPTVELSLFRVRSVVLANSAIFLLAGGQLVFSYYLTFRLQTELGYSTMRTGLAFLPGTVAATASALVASRLVRRLGLRLVLAISLAAVALGAAMTGYFEVSTYVSLLMPVIAVSVGAGVAIVLLIGLSTNGVAPKFDGTASGLVLTMYQIGAAFWIAIFSKAAAQGSTGGVNTSAAPGVVLMTAALLPACATVLVLAVRTERRRSPRWMSPRHS